jgi:hypothetical protein
LHDSAAQSEFIRRFKSNPFVFIGTIIFLVIVIVAFVLVPAIVPEAGGGGVDLNFGYYNKTPITYIPGNYFARIQENIARYMQSSLDESNYLYLSYQIWRDAFEETVVHTGILDEMSRSGYKAPPEVVDKRTARLPQFQENGHFSAARYRALDNVSRMSLWREVQDSIAEEYYRGDVTGLRISSREAPFIAAMASPERKFDLVIFPLTDYPDSEIIAHIKANPDTFRVTHLSKITINSGEREALQILASVEEGTSTFEDAARTQSQDSYAEKGGDMGIKLAYELSTEVPDPGEREKVTGLTAAGALSPLVKVPTGWAFFRCEAPPGPADTSDQATLDKIRIYMTDFERGRMEDWLIREAEQFIAQVRESDFNAAAAARGLETRNLGPLPLNYGGTDLFTSLSSFSIGELTYAESNENFWKTAFTTPVAAPSAPFVIGSNVIVLYPTEEKPAEEATVENIKTRYSSYWLSYNAEQSLRSFFLSHPKLQDNFRDTFIKYFSPVQEQ